MKEELSIDIIGLAGAYSYALDCIEAELVNIKNKHGKRVAYISICMAEYWKIQGDELQDLAMCALLHDNALTQYISEELKKDSVINCKKDLSEKKTNLHCIYNPIIDIFRLLKTDFSDIAVYLQSSFIVRYLQNFFNTHLYYFDIFFCKFFIKFLQQFRTYFCHTTVWKLLFCTFCGQIDNDLILTIVFCQRIKQ